MDSANDEFGTVFKFKVHNHSMYVFIVNAETRNFNEMTSFLRKMLLSVAHFFTIDFFST